MHRPWLQHWRAWTRVSSSPDHNTFDQCTNNSCYSWGSGTAEYPYLIAPADAIRTQAAKDGTRIVTSATDGTSAGASAAAQADTAIVFITADSGEGYITVEGNAGDRNNLDPWHSGLVSFRSWPDSLLIFSRNDLVKAVAAVNKNVIVVGE